MEIFLFVFDIIMLYHKYINSLNCSETDRFLVCTELANDIVTLRCFTDGMNLVY